MVKSSIQEPKVNGIAALYNIHTSLANRSIPASLWLDKIQKSRLSHIEEWKIDQDNVPESLKTLQIWEYYTEQEMFKDNEWISEDRLYAKGIEGPSPASRGNFILLTLLRYRQTTVASFPRMQRPQYEESDGKPLCHVFNHPIWYQ